MSYAVIAIVILLVVIFVIVLSRKSKEGTLPQGGQKQQQLGDKPRVSARPAETESAQEAAVPSTRPEAKAPADQTRPDASVSADKAAPAASVPAPAARDVSTLRKGLAKSRSEWGFLGRLAQPFRGQERARPHDRRSSRGDPAHVRRRRRHDPSYPRVGCAMGSARTSSRARRPSGTRCAPMRPESFRIGGGKIDLVHKADRGLHGRASTASAKRPPSESSRPSSRPKAKRSCSRRATRSARPRSQQLEVWGKRVGCEVVKGKEGADPGAVIFDAIQKAKQGGHRRRFGRHGGPPADENAADGRAQEDRPHHAEGHSKGRRTRPCSCSTRPTARTRPHRRRCFRRRSRSPASC